MAILKKGIEFESGDQITAEKLNKIIEDAEFDSNAVEGPFLLVDAATGRIVMPDGAITNAKIAINAAIAGTKIAPNFGAQDIVTTGNVGINTSSPTQRLDVNGVSRLRGQVLIGSSAQVIAGVPLNIDSAGILINSNRIIHCNTNESRLLLSGSDTNKDTSARIQLFGNNHIDSQNLATLDAAEVRIRSATGTNRLVITDGNLRASRSTDGAIMTFRHTATDVGNISVTTTSTAYNTSSDYRLKENVIPVDGGDAVARLLQLKPVRFNFISTPETQVDGFLAHEAQAVVPEAVTGEKDAVDAEGKPAYQGIDQAKLVPLLTAALQTALNRIDQLEQRVTALESA